ncbi:MAG: DUF3883 domain-containing protein [Chloroflexi bacterium]|nr:DUF3883 domain-containing protein [Chloroflexota bacterium]
MTLAPSLAEPSDAKRRTQPARDLDAHVRDVLAHAVDGHRKKLKVYESLRNLNEVVGTEYGDRVLYELIQNAHDAHAPGDQGRIAVRLVIRSETEGVLYVANGGNGFRREDVDAIMNIATTAKRVGEGIGNKGLGFRSIEALTDHVRIFSRSNTTPSSAFDGFCFRFATLHEVEILLRRSGVDDGIAAKVAATVPRYLVPIPLGAQPEDIVAFARRGYASVIVAPLATADAVQLALHQVNALADLELPLLLFLDRIADFRIVVETPGAPPRRRLLTRRHRPLGEIPELPGCTMHEVGVGEARRFLVVRRELDKPLVLAAVERSISRAPQITRWRDWRGQPTVSVAVGLSTDAVTAGRFYNFLPMGPDAVSPLNGHLDAPFFAEIDRRDAEFDLPLNATLLKAGAEACAHAALHIAADDSSEIPQRAVFDLIAWTGKFADKLDNAFDATGTPLRNAPVIPSIPVNSDRWAALTTVTVFPAADLSLMKAPQVARRTGASLASPQLDPARLGRLEAMAKRKYLLLPPSGPRLAQVAERFAQSLADGHAAPSTWSRFYDDLRRLFNAAGQKLDELAGASIMLDRSAKLRSAGRRGATSGADVFVRSESTRRKRAKNGVPLPPAPLTRRYRFLNEKIVFRQDTLNAFVRAGLVREYDPVEALASLGSALGAKANENRRREALTWAFGVWRTAATDIDDALRNAKLYVSTAGGWRPAQDAAFSSSWTSLGLTLENFLVEASQASTDCRRARDALLTDFADWPAAPGSSKRRWLEFLSLIGVTDGLKPVGAAIQDSGDGWSWRLLTRGGDATEGLDPHWCAEASGTSIPNPYTAYGKRGAAWRLPGQIEYDKLSKIAKEAFQELVFSHLATHSDQFLIFDIGRFKRSQRDWNLRTLPTPLATFLRSRAWIAASTHHEPGLRKPSDCWASRTRQGRPPRFMHRVPDTVASLLEHSDELADLAFSSAIGLRDWNSAETAGDRLQALAIVAPALAAPDRRDFRREYRRAWNDLGETDAALPPDLDLTVTRDGGFALLRGHDESPTVIVTNNPQAFGARILAAAGHPLLDIGDAAAETVTERLAATGRFAPRQLDGVSVRLLVDGEPFVPRTSDPPLVSLDLAWLPEVVSLGHELLAERLERGVPQTMIERRIRAIRVRRCRTINLVVDEQNVPSRDSMAWYGFEDDDLPTLILSERVQLGWLALGRDLSGTISRLLDTRLRFLEKLLLRLALGQPSDTLDRPTDDVLTAALGCDMRALQEHRAALRTDLGHLLHLLMPVLAYVADVTLARRLASDAEHDQTGFDLRQWLRDRLPSRQPSPDELIDACARAQDRAGLRRELGLDYERFNHALIALDEEPLSNEAELRSMYHAYLQRLTPGIHERLRRTHLADYLHGRDLTTYNERKTLAFLEFDDAWVLTRETLDNQTVEEHVAALLDRVLGEAPNVDLPNPLGLVERNRRTARSFACTAAPIIGAWSRHNAVPIREPWRTDDPQSVVRRLEDAGLLDFERLDDAHLPGLCQRAGCWPENMAQTLNLASLGLDQSTLKEEEKRRETERQQDVIDRRSIHFAGTKLDTGDPSFPEEFRQLAELSIANDDAWYERSSRPRLARFDQSAPRSRRPGGGTGGTRKPSSEDQRQAMGLASEWLVFQYLRRRYVDAFDESCWVSSNRTRFFGGSQGDDTAGYDFCVKTPQAEWLYEVKSSLDQGGDFELTPNEMRVAAGVPTYGRRRYRILYVSFVFSPSLWTVLELPNPMDQRTRDQFNQVGRGSVRFRFERATTNTR